MRSACLRTSPDTSWAWGTRWIWSSASRWAWTCESLLTVLLCVYTDCSDLCGPVASTRFDCVFPTRTARFGVALVTAGSVRLKAKENAADLRPVDDHCKCTTCRNYTRAALHTMFRENNALAAQLLTKHNVSYMMRLMRTMRQVGDASLSPRLQHRLTEASDCHLRQSWRAPRRTSST